MSQKDLDAIHHCQQALHDAGKGAYWGVALGLSAHDCLGFIRSGTPLSVAQQQSFLAVRALELCKELGLAVPEPPAPPPPKT